MQKTIYNRLFTYKLLATYTFFFIFLFWRFGFFQSNVATNDVSKQATKFHYFRLKWFCRTPYCGLCNFVLRIFPVQFICTILIQCHCVVAINDILLTSQIQSYICVFLNVDFGQLQLSTESKQQPHAFDRIGTTACRRISHHAVHNRSEIPSKRTDNWKCLWIDCPLLM